MSETKQDKWNRGRTLFLESVHKPDHELRKKIVEDKIKELNNLY